MNFARVLMCVKKLEKKTCYNNLTPQGVSDMTHKQLVEIGRSWLAKRCPVVITELSSAAGEIPDVIGFEGRIYDIGFGTHLIECKTSISDFNADIKKLYRRHSYMGMGDYRYYLSEKGLIGIEKIPEKWGLLEVQDSGKIFIAVHAQKQEADKKREVSFLISTMRRLKIDSGDHFSLKVKSYNIQTKNNATLEINNNAPGGEE